MLSPDKEAKLRALAERGVGGEAQNAQEILKKNGIDWKKKQTTSNFKTEDGMSVSLDDLLKMFNVNKEAPLKTYEVKIKRHGDSMLLAILVEELTKSKKALLLGSSGVVEVQATENEMKLIMKKFNEHREQFTRHVVGQGLDYYKKYM